MWRRLLGARLLLAMMVAAVWRGDSITIPRTDDPFLP
jgi:hypothetical protein